MSRHACRQKLKGHFLPFWGGGGCKRTILMQLAKSLRGKKDQMPIDSINCGFDLMWDLIGIF